MSSCFAQSHVSVLPPRAIYAPTEQVEAELIEALQDFSPFRLEMDGIEVFETTSVIHLAIGRGRDELKRLHDRLNRDGLSSAEVHEYHPHVTLAQDFPPQELQDLLRLAKDRWASFPYRRWFEVETLTFVQNTIGNRWLDLSSFPLAHPVLSGTR